MAHTTIRDITKEINTRNRAIKSKYQSKDKCNNCESRNVILISEKIMKNLFNQ